MHLPDSALPHRYACPDPNREYAASDGKGLIHARRVGDSADGSILRRFLKLNFLPVIDISRENLSKLAKFTLLPLLQGIFCGVGEGLARILICKIFQIPLKSAFNLSSNDLSKKPPAPDDGPHLYKKIIPSWIKFS